MPSLGPRLPLTFWLWVLPTCLSASMGGWAGSQPAHSPLVLLNPLFCEQAGLCLAAAAAKSLQSCLTLCHPIDGSPPASPVPGTLQARTLEWVAISFSNAWKQKVKVKSLSRVRLLATPWTAAYQAPLSMGFSRQEYWSGVPLPSLGCALGKRFSWESSLSLSFFFSLAIPQFGLLSHVSFLRLSSGHSGLVITLSMQPAPPCSALACWCGWASGLLCHWELQFRRVFCVFFTPHPTSTPRYFALWDLKTPHRPTSERVSWCLQTSPPLGLPPWDGSPSLTLLSLFLSFIFCSASFWREWIAQHSNDLLMNLWGRKWSPRPIPLPC